MKLGRRTVWEQKVKLNMVIKSAAGGGLHVDMTALVSSLSWINWLVGWLVDWDWCLSYEGEVAGW